MKQVACETLFPSLSRVGWKHFLCALACLALPLSAPAAPHAAANEPSGNAGAQVAAAAPAGAPAPGGAVKLTGLEIARRNDRARRSNTEHQVMTMILENSRGQKRVRTIEGWSHEVSDDEERRFSKFLEPADVKNTTLLYYDYDAKDDDTWLYLPALKKVKRILSTNKKDYFMGSDFTYEDMENADLINWDYTVLREEPQSGVDCYVVQALPNNDTKRRNSGYSKVINWVGKKDFVSRRTEYYDKKNRKSKILTFEDIRPTSPTDPRPRAHKMLMDNLITGHKTQLSFTTIELDVPVNDKVFSQRNLRQ